MRISDWSSDVCSSDQTTAGSACACELRRARCRDFRSERNQSMTRLLFVSASALALAACAGKTPPPAIHYDAADFRAAVEEAEPAKPIEIVETPVPLPLPGQLQPPPSVKPEACPPTARVAAANRAELGRAAWRERGGQ